MPEITVLGIKLEVNLEQAEKFKTLEAQVKQTNQALVDGFKSGDISAGDFNKRMAESDGQLREYAQAIKTASGFTEEHSNKQAALHDVLGASRREAGLLTGTMLEMSGAGQTATQSLEALMSGIGPVGLGIVALSAGLKEYVDWLDKASKKELELAQVQATAQGIARQHAEIKAQDAETTRVLTTQAENLAKQIAAIESGMQSADTRTRQYAEAADKAAGGVANLKAALADIEKQINFLNNKDIFSSAQANQLVTFTEQADRASISVQSLNDALNANSASLKNNAGAFVEETQAQADNVARQTEMQTKMAGWDKERRDREEAQRKAQSAADEAARKQASEAARMAEAQTKLSTERIAIEKIAGASAAATFDQIVAHAGDAADAVKLVAIWMSTLKPEIRTQIDILVAAHLDSFLASLLGGRGPRQSTGNQQGDEWDFTLGGENQSVRFDYERRYGQTAAANEAWQRDHRAELQQQGYTGPGQTPGSSAAAYAAANGFAPSAGGSGSVTNVYQLNLSTQKSQSNVVQDFKSLKSLAGANT